MTRATDFEFSNRWWLFGLIFALGFAPLAADHVPVGSRVADYLAAAAFITSTAALHIVFGVVAGVMVAAALIRLWASAYLGREVVHDHALHSEALRADGPYRRVRNPLYFGNVLMALSLSLFAPLLGAPLVIAGMLVFCYRLIGREEAGLAAQQGERYRAYQSAVPRLFPSLLARIPSSGAKPDWPNGFSAEAFFMAFAVGAIGFAITLDIRWLWGAFLASPLLSWLAGLAVPKRTP